MMAAEVSEQTELTNRLRPHARVLFFNLLRNRALWKAAMRSWDDFCENRACSFNSAKSALLAACEMGSESEKAVPLSRDEILAKLGGQKALRAVVHSTLNDFNERKSVRFESVKQALAEARKLSQSTSA